MFPGQGVVRPPPREDWVGLQGGGTRFDDAWGAGPRPGVGGYFPPPPPPPPSPPARAGGGGGGGGGGGALPPGVGIGFYWWGGGGAGPWGGVSPLWGVPRWNLLSKKPFFFWVFPQPPPRRWHSAARPLG